MFKMTAKSVLLRPQGLRPHLPPLLRHWVYFIGRSQTGCHTHFFQGGREQWKTKTEK